MSDLEHGLNRNENLGRLNSKHCFNIQVEFNAVFSTKSADLMTLPS